MERKASEKIANIGKVYRTQKNAVWIEAEMKDFEKAFGALKAAGAEHISAITGTDRTKYLEVIYHFWHGGKELNLKFRLPAKNSRVRTITGHYPGAELFERELAEMLGIDVEGHPSPGRLLLDKGSPKAPLRRKAGGTKAGGSK